MWITVVGLHFQGVRYILRYISLETIPGLCQLIRFLLPLRQRWRMEIHNDYLCGLEFWSERVDYRQTVILDYVYV